MAHGSHDSLDKLHSAKDMQGKLQGIRKSHLYFSHSWCLSETSDTAVENVMNQSSHAKV